MKSLLFIVIALASSQVLAAPNCTAEDVRAQLIAKTGSIFTEIDSSFGIPMCANAEDEKQNAEETWNPDCVSTSNVMKAVYNVQWNEESQSFKSADFLNWQCAASVQCWAWLEAQCDGSFEVRQDGED